MLESKISKNPSKKKSLIRAGILGLCLAQNTQPIIAKPKHNNITHKVKNIFDETVTEINRRGFSRRAIVGGIVGASEGKLRKSIGGTGNFAGALGGVGITKGIVSGLYYASNNVLAETTVGSVLGRTQKKEHIMSEDDIQKLRNREQIIASIISDGLYGHLGGVVFDGISFGIIGGGTLMTSKKIVNYLDKLLSNKHNGKPIITGKLRNILTYSISGSLLGSCVGIKRAKGSLGLSKEILLGIIRGSLIGVLTEEEKNREKRANDKVVSKKKLLL